MVRSSIFLYNLEDDNDDARRSVKCEGFAHFDCNEFLPQDRTASKDYYLEVMRRLREAIQEKPIIYFAPS